MVVNDCIQGKCCVGACVRQTEMGKTRCPEPVLQLTLVDVILITFGHGIGIGSRNDIALLRLNESVPLNSESPTMSLVSPICLPWSKDKPSRNIHKGNKTLLTGWGHVTNNRWDRIDNAKRL